MNKNIEELLLRNFWLRLSSYINCSKNMSLLGSTTLKKYLTSPCNIQKIPAVIFVKNFPIAMLLDFLQPWFLLSLWYYVYFIIWDSFKKDK